MVLLCELRVISVGYVILMTHSAAASYRKWKLLWKPKSLKLRALSLNWLSTNKRQRRGSLTKTKSSKICGMYVSLTFPSFSTCFVLITFCFGFFFLFSKNHARQLESLQASLETEVKSKSDLVGISRMPLLLGKTDIRSACGRRFLDRRLYWGLSFSRSISMWVEDFPWSPQFPSWSKWTPTLVL